MTILGIDLGTGSVKAGLVDGEGSLLVSASRRYPRPSGPSAAGRSEIDVSTWWTAVVDAVRAVVASAPSDEPVEAVGVAGQMHGVVLVDKSGKAVRPAIEWPDERATTVLDAFQEAVEATGVVLANPVVPGMMGPMLAWMADDDPAGLDAASAALSPKDWLRLQLGGEVLTEPSDASGTLLWDMAADGWHDGLVAYLGLDRGLLADVVASTTVVATLRPEAAAALGLGGNVAVVAGAADTAAAILGAGTTPGQRQLGVGSGAQVVVPTATWLADATGRTHCYRQAGDGWYAMGAVSNAGLAIEWALTALGASWDEAYAALESTQPGASGVTFLPFVAGERAPHPAPALRAGWVGAAHHHDRAHLLRAVFEGVAFGLRTKFDALAEMGCAGTEQGPVRLVGGGSLHPSWRQLLADVLGVDLQVLAQADATVTGAALLAAQGIGRLPDARSLHPGTKAGGIVRPRQLTGVSPDYEPPYQRFREHARLADAGIDAVE